MFERISSWLTVAVTVLLVSCGGGGGSPGQNPNAATLSVGGLTSLTVLPGEARRIPVTGGMPPYRAVSAESAVVAAVMDGTSLVVGGVGAGGTASVVVTDAAGGSVPISVKVGTSVPLYTTAPAALQLGVGPSEAQTFRVAGGVKPYVITGNAPLVATVTQLDAEQWRIQGVTIGDMKVRIRDAAGTELEVAVTVGSPELRISSDNLTLPIGIPATVVLSGGQKPYVIAGAIPAAIEVRAVTGSDDTYQITGLLATGDVDVVFADAAGKTVKTKVTVNTATTQVRVAPSSIRLGEASGSVVPFVVHTAAAGPLTVFSSHPNLVTISNVVMPVFASGATGVGGFTGTVTNTCVTDDTEVTLTVIDAARSVGTATVTVVNSNATCP